MVKVFLCMFLGLTVSGLILYIFANSSLIGSLYSHTGGISGASYVVMFAPFCLALLMGCGVDKLSYPPLVLIFLSYSILTGMRLSLVFLVYTNFIYFNFFLHF